MGWSCSILWRHLWIMDSLEKNRLLFPTENFKIVNLGLKGHKQRLSRSCQEMLPMFFFSLRNLGTLTTFGCCFNIIYWNSLLKSMFIVVIYWCLVIVISMEFGKSFGCLHMSSHWPAQTRWEELSHRFEN